MKLKTLINRLALLAIFIGCNMEIFARPLGFCHEDEKQKEEIPSFQNGNPQIDKSFYNIAETVIDSCNVNDILHATVLTAVIDLKKQISDLKMRLIFEYIKNLGIYEKMMARQKITHEEWIRLTTDYTLASYNLELLLYACELRLE